MTDPTIDNRIPSDPQWLAIARRLITAATPEEYAQLRDELHGRYLQLVRGGQTTSGLPYPDPTDPVAEGADAIRALAEALTPLVYGPAVPATNYSAAGSRFIVRGDEVDVNLRITWTGSSTGLPNNADTPVGNPIPVEARQEGGSTFYLPAIFAGATTFQIGAVQVNMASGAVTWRPFNSGVVIQSGAGFSLAFIAIGGPAA